GWVLSDRAALIGDLGRETWRRRRGPRDGGSTHDGDRSAERAARSGAGWGGDALPPVPRGSGARDAEALRGRQGRRGVVLRRARPLHQNAGRLDLGEERGLRGEGDA